MKTPIVIRIRVVSAMLMGRRAAAMGYPRETPFAEGTDAAVSWLQAYDAATANQRNGRDLFGHPPNIPVLCARDVRAVCNCCSSCRSHCTVPKYPAGLITRLLRKVFP